MSYYQAVCTFFHTTTPRFEGEPDVTHPYLMSFVGTAKGGIHGNFSDPDVADVYEYECPEAGNSKMLVMRNPHNQFVDGEWLPIEKVDGEWKAWDGHRVSSIGLAALKLRNHRESERLAAV